MTEYTGTTIRVTWEDINLGSTKAMRCPIALATQRALDLTAGACRTYMLIIQLGGPPQYYEVPESAAEFIKNHDAGRPVQPFEFQIGERIQP